MDFESLEVFYISYIRFGLENNVDYNYAKLGNKMLHKFCENIVDNSNYADKAAKKQELELIKESLSQEIDAHYQHK